MTKSMWKVSKRTKTEQDFCFCGDSENSSTKSRFNIFLNFSYEGELTVY